MRKMLKALLLRIRHYRRLLQEAEVNIATRWLFGNTLLNALPYHSSPTHPQQVHNSPQHGSTLDT